jgi:hypothetical protein
VLDEAGGEGEAESEVEVSAIPHSHPERNLDGFPESTRAAAHVCVRAGYRYLRATHERRREVFIGRLRD